MINLDKEIWTFVTSTLADALPECEVTRAYDILEKLSQLESATKPRVFVCLDGKETDPISKDDVKETRHFEVFLAKYIAAKEEADVTDEMDALLPLVERIQDRFFFKAETFTASDQTTQQVKLISADPDSGELYDLDFFTDSESFLCALSISTVNVRKVNTPTSTTTTGETTP